MEVGHQGGPRYRPRLQNPWRKHDLNESVRGPGRSGKTVVVEASEEDRCKISHVARMIGTSRPTVHSLIKKHGLSPKEFKE